MKHSISAILIVVLFGISCKKSETPTPIEPPVKFMSLTAGSTWNYALINNVPVPATTSSYTITSTSTDSTANGKQYHVFTNSSGGTNQYYNIAGNDYYTFENLPAAFGGSSVEILYLKDAAAVGTSWSQPYTVTASGFPLNVTLINTITEKGISKTVNSIAYDNVIHVTTTFSVTVSGVPLPAGALTTDIESFYAPKFGLIQSVNKINLNFSGNVNNTDQQTNLNSADIK